MPISPRRRDSSVHPANVTESMSAPAPKQSDDLDVPMPTVVNFLRQLSHDLRNQLNAAELQSAYLKEIAGEGEVKEEVQRLRGMLGEMSTALQRLTSSLASPKLNEMSYEAGMFLEDLQSKVASQFAEKNSEIEWRLNVNNSVICIDPQILPQAIVELISNAFQHGRAAGKINIAAESDGELRITITEPKTAFAESTAQWGREPFRKLKHGQYGLGLHRARNIIEAHRGRLEARHDSASSSLVTTVALPVIGHK
ncbi:MAG: sensor histidine kinase [Chthoniobacterales bacterium]